MSTRQKVITVLIGLVIFFGAGNAEADPFFYLYDGSVVPDDLSMQNIFSTQVFGGANWNASGGELTITTVQGKNAAAWFGNHNPDYDTVPWDMADSDQGNFVSIRSKLGANSGEWNFYISDGSFGASYLFMPGEVIIGGYGNYTIDTTMYHNYAIQLVGGKVLYTIDGLPVYYGEAYNADRKGLIIGDGSGATIGGYGSMVIDEVMIKTVAAIKETISTPTIPSGVTSVNTDRSYSYSTGGSSSSLGHNIQYFFDWGDGTNSGWLPAGTTSASKSWASAGTYPVMAKARCETDPSVESNWSEALQVTIIGNLSIVKDTETRLVDFFPKTINGENGIFLQYRESTGTYVNLTNASDYYCPLRGLGEKPSPLGEDFSMIAVWRTTANRAIRFMI